MNFHKRIRDTREDNDLRQEDIAEILGITKQQYQLYESGKRDFRYYHIIALAKYYKLSADYLLGLTNEPRKLK